MERQMKNCPFCGGTIKPDDDNLEWANKKIAEGVRSYAVGAQCTGCGFKIFAHSHDVADPENIDQVIDLLYEKVNRREGEKRLRLELEAAKLDNKFLEDKAGDEKGRADALEKENTRLRNAIVEAFINKVVTT